MSGINKVGPQCRGDRSSCRFTKKESSRRRRRQARRNPEGAPRKDRYVGWTT